MQTRTPIYRFLGVILASSILFTAAATAQTPSAAPIRRPDAAAAAIPAGPENEAQLSAVQEQLIALLRTSPTLTSVVSRDPSLLSDAEYVNRNNPQLGQFLVSHPEVARNPDYYLFTHLNCPGCRRSEALERSVWPDFSQPRENYSATREIAHDLIPMVAFACFLIALIWLIRQLLENRRWSRIFKLQSEVHGRLIEKFSSTQEIASYMGTEAGRRFLEAAPIPVGFESDQRMPNAVGKVLVPLQAGIVLVLLGAGFLFLRYASPDMNIPMLVLGTIVLMPGIGFIISAGITWVMASRLGLIPDAPAAPSNSPDRQ